MFISFEPVYMHCILLYVTVYTQYHKKVLIMDLVITDLQQGTGKEAVKGKEITVHYTGMLEDGTVFDSSVTRKQPLTFTLGAGMVIIGWDQGFDGMKEGGKRKLTIPPHMAYGSRGAGGVIPPNATLIFDVELLQVED
jgi:peptidylprolyl isomerase